MDKPLKDTVFNDELGQPCARCNGTGHLAHPNPVVPCYICNGGKQEYPNQKTSYYRTQILWNAMLKGNEDD